MILTTSHNCWRGPYVAFNRFRNALAIAAGYGVRPETHGDFTHETVQLDWEGIARRNPGCHLGEWNDHERDALLYLLVHSDCEGVLHPPQASALADRIDELIPALLSPTLRAAAEQFVRGLRAAGARGEDVSFN